MRILNWFLVVAILLVTNASGQAADNGWKEGSVWALYFVKTKPGKFDSYMAELSKIFQPFAQKLIKDNVAISSKILEVPFPADNAPDIIVMVEFKNMAVFDKGRSYFESVVDQILGDRAASEKSEIDREQLRTVRGEILTRELQFEK
jgi:hypothetical protein